MSSSRITVLKLRQLKPCASTTEMLNSLPNVVRGFGERMFQFDVKIPTKLWKAILRRRKLATDSRYATCLLLSQASTENDICIRTYEDETTLDFLNANSYVRHTMSDAVYVAPVETELFDRFDIRVLRSVVLFRSPEVINFNVVLDGLGSSSPIWGGEVIFDVSDFPSPPIGERPSDAIVSYTINI